VEVSVVEASPEEAVVGRKAKRARTAGTKSKSPATRKSTSKRRTKETDVQ